MIAAAQQAGVRLMVAENARFMAAVRQCKALMAQGGVGDLRVVQLHEETPFQPGDWRSRRALNGGGVFIDSGIHKVHLLRYLARSPRTSTPPRSPRPWPSTKARTGWWS